MTVSKRVFHCVICGSVLHVHNVFDDAICCGHPMHLAFKEYCVPSNWVLAGHEEFVGNGFSRSSLHHSELATEPGVSENHG